MAALYRANPSLCHPYSSQLWSLPLSCVRPPGALGCRSAGPVDPCIVVSVSLSRQGHHSLGCIPLPFFSHPPQKALPGHRERLPYSHLSCLPLLLYCPLPGRPFCCRSFCQLSPSLVQTCPWRRTASHFPLPPVAPCLPPDPSPSPGLSLGHGCGSFPC
ncbi:hypothetical protein NP493_992g01001 [Ridgeia piscesae]|uniref:Uncharacterized protein n=1 Tax=Ridgeia piscesae TaxID=27915 RepID=A0AAD9KIN2_RIDPI|nr:hypothetical protein NP493_992g01001 [Ridgeia piscesae]